VNIEDANWDTDRADVQIRYKAEEFEAVHKIVESLDIPIRIRVQKSTEGQLITDAIVQNSVAILQLIIAFWQLHGAMKDDELSEDHESEQSNLTITVSGNVVINSQEMPDSASKAERTTGKEMPDRKDSQRVATDSE
jgi:hypothetical protein